MARKAQGKQEKAGWTVCPLRRDGERETHGKRLGQRGSRESKGVKQEHRGRQAVQAEAAQAGQGRQWQAGQAGHAGQAGQAGQALQAGQTNMAGRACEGMWAGRIALRVPPAETRLTVYRRTQVAL